MIEKKQPHNNVSLETLVQQNARIFHDKETNEDTSWNLVIFLHLLGHLLQFSFVIIVYTPIGQFLSVTHWCVGISRPAFFCNLS